MAQDSNPPVYFHCKLCGECCSSWNIPIEGHKASQLLEKPWVQTRLTETHRELTELGEGLYRIPLTDENVCVFLADDKRCMVEVNEGLTLKPHECQRFPFASIRMPDGSVKHESSAACKNISEALLLAFQPILPKPDKQSGQPNDTLQALQQQEAKQFEDVTQFPEQIALGIWGRLCVKEYEAFQAELRSIFMMPGIHPEAALKQAHALLKKRRNNSQSSISDFRFHPRLGWAFSMFFMRKPYRSMNWASLLSGTHYHDPRLFGLPVDIRQQSRIPWNPEHNPRLNAFLYSILQRKRLLSSGGSLSSLFAMAAVACLLVQWYAKTLAWLQQNTESAPPENAGNPITAMDVSTAIRLVERYYTGHQPRFMAFFTNRWKGWLVEHVLLCTGSGKPNVHPTVIPLQEKTWANSTP